MTETNDPTRGSQGIQGIQGFQGIQGEVGAKGEPGLGSEISDVERTETNKLLAQNFEAMTRLTDALSEVSLGFSREAEQRGRSVLLLRRAVWVLAAAMVVLCVVAGIFYTSYRREQDRASAAAATACAKTNEVRATILDGFDTLLIAATPKAPTTDQQNRIVDLRSKLAAQLAPKKC